MFDLAEVGGRDGKGGSEIGLFHAALLAQRFETSACENAVAGHDILLLSPCGRGYGGLAAQPLSRSWRGGGRQPPPQDLLGGKAPSQVILSRKGRERRPTLQTITLQLCKFAFASAALNGQTAV